MDDVTLQLEVSDGADPLHREKLTSDLRDALVADAVVAATGLVVTQGARRTAAPGAKGFMTDTVTVLVAGAPYARPAADALIAAIQSWCARDRRTSVTVRDGERSVQIVGSPTRRQAELLEQFWRDEHAIDDGES